MKWIKRFFILALIALVVIQFIRPDKNKGGYDSLEAFLTETKPTEEVQTILKSSCYDCHSNETVYPWYAQIAPISYWLDDHIRHGKRELNFANWSTYSPKRKDHKLEEIIEMIEDKEMPLDSYTWVHKDAILEKVEIEAIKNWVIWARIKYLALHRVE